MLILKNFLRLFYEKNVKLLFLTAFLTLTLQSPTVYSKTLIISDVDDTIKMTDVLGSKKTIFFNGVFREKAFNAMSELYQQLDKPDTIIHYVSGSPKIIRMRVEDFLEENDFPQTSNLTLRNRLSDNTATFKLAAIQNIIAAENPEKIILIGDDTEHDPEIYAAIAQYYPIQVEAIYIRSIRNKQLPELHVMKSFFSAVEIAAYEMLKGVMDKRELKDVANAYIYRFGSSGVFIKNRYCPKNGREELTILAAQFTDEDVKTTLNKVQKKIIKSCR